MFIPMVFGVSPLAPISCESFVIHYPIVSSLGELPSLQRGDLLIMDVDDTLVYDGPWNLGVRPSETLRSMQHLHSLVRRQAVLKLMELYCPELLKKWKTQGVLTMAMTARPLELFEAKKIDVFSENAITKEEASALRVSQLQPLGLSFNCPIDDCDHEAFTLRQGVAFTFGEKKGVALIELLKLLTQTPRRIIFVDNDRKHLQHVTEALQEEGVDFECFHYVSDYRPDEKSTEFEKIRCEVLELCGVWVNTWEEALRVLKSASQCHCERSAAIPSLSF